MANYIWMNATICVDLPDNIPQPPSDFDLYDEWYDTWVSPAVDKLFMNPIISDIDIHNEEFIMNKGD